MAKKVSKHYIDNKKMYEALLDYRKKVIESEALNKEKPRLSNYIGECFMLIANRLSTKSNFIGYPFRSEMVFDGIENCIIAVDNFDPEKYNNPFAYFTQIIYFAFLRRIQKEKKQEYIKAKLLQKMSISGDFSISQDGFDDGSNANVKVNTDYMNNVIQTTENGIIAKQKKKVAEKKKGIEKFYVEE